MNSQSGRKNMQMEDEKSNQNNTLDKTKVILSVVEETPMDSRDVRMDDEGCDDDSLAAVASEDDDDNYTEFVDESGKSRCTTSISVTAQVSSHYAHSSRADKHTSSRNHVVSNRPRLVSPTFDASITSINESTLRPCLEEQYSYGPDGLVFNMNVPWERSLRRQMKKSEAPIPTSAGFFGSNYRFSTPEVRSNGLAGGTSKSKSTNKMILGHTESRDYAIDVGSFQSDDFSLGTCTIGSAPIVPSRIQTVHRSFLYTNHDSFVVNDNQRAVPPEEIANPVQSNRHYEGRHDNAIGRQPNEMGNENAGKQVNCSSKIRIGDVVKVCRSTDESLVSLLTSNFPHEDYNYKASSRHGERSIQGNIEYPPRVLANPRGSNRSVGSNSSRRHRSSQGYRTSNSNRATLPDSPNHYMEFLELEPSQSNSSTIIQHTVHSVANDTSCFCLGYNVLDYVLPPQYADDTVVTTSNNRGTTKVFSPGPHTRLAPVLESGTSGSVGSRKHNKTKYLDSPTSVVDLSSAANIDMKFLRQPLEEPIGHTKRRSRHNRRIDA